MNNSLRKALPSIVTFTSLLCALSAVVLAIDGRLTAASLCILAGYILDAVDGKIARGLGVASDFGLQLDSLVDVVAFGVAPSALVYQYGRGLSLNPVLAWIACAGYLIAGVFRLARFNLLPAKTSGSESVGLTISTAGATGALSVLSNLRYDDKLMPIGLFPALMLILALLMISRIRYPALDGILQRRWLSVAGLGVAGVLAIWLSPQLVWLGITNGYVSFGLVRAIVGLVR